MRYLTNIQVAEAIVHILDTSGRTGLELSERTLPLDGNQRLISYLAGHIQNSLSDSAAKAARFTDLTPGGVFTDCLALLNSGGDLVVVSRKFAERLHAIMSRDKRISAGDLVVCIYRSGNPGDSLQYLALLKIDPTEVLRHKIERDQQGRAYVSFTVESDVMPTAREKLQKCAFVQPLQPRPEYDMMLLDRQVGGEAMPVAKFFSSEFLGAELVLDSRQRTERMYRGLVSAQSKLRPVLEPQQDEILTKAIEGVLHQESVNLDTWIEALALPQEHKTEINDTISGLLPDRAFEVDQTYAQTLRQKRRFLGDHDLKVEVSAEWYGDVVKTVKPIPSRSQPDYYEVVLHTKKWQEVVR